MIQALRKAVADERLHFGPKCAKFAGAVTVELLRSELSKISIETSRRDVFIRGVPYEIDLLVPVRNATPRLEMLYEPSDVCAVLEVKNAGSFGQSTIETTRRTFLAVKKADRRIQCAYVALAERRGYSWALTRENLGFPAFTFFLHAGGDRNRIYSATGQWEDFLDFLKGANLICSSPRRSSIGGMNVLA